MLDAYIYDGLRSPFGRSGGALSGIRPDDLLAEVIRPLMDRSTLDGSAKTAVAWHATRRCALACPSRCRAPSCSATAAVALAR